VSERVRAVLVTGNGRLLTIKRIKPGQEPYWILPGGGVEAYDASLEAALHRELQEELAATAKIHSLIQVVHHWQDRHHIYLARIHHWDWASRSGPEFTTPGQGEYALEQTPLTVPGLTSINLEPPAVRDLLKSTVASGADLFALPDLRIGFA
jgi:ADP-ribose pyrophosphatase YjhB (NUDIX family)